MLFLKQLVVVLLFFWGGRDVVFAAEAGGIVEVSGSFEAVPTESDDGCDSVPTEGDGGCDSVSTEEDDGDGDTCNSDSSKFFELKSLIFAIHLLISLL